MKRPLFEKRHFEWLADFARDQLLPEQMKYLADRLKSTNSNFKYDKFLRVAGYYE